MLSIFDSESFSRSTRACVYSPSSSSRSPSLTSLVFREDLVGSRFDRVGDLVKRPAPLRVGQFRELEGRGLCLVDVSFDVGLSHHAHR